MNMLVKSKLFKVPQSLIHRAIVESACKVHAYNVTNIYKLLTIFSNVVLVFPTFSLFVSICKRSNLAKFCRGGQPALVSTGLLLKA